MTQAPPDQSPVSLHYPDSEPVRLDVTAIVALGNRIRRRQYAALATAALLAVAVVPGTVALSSLHPRSSIEGSGHAGAAHRAAKVPGPPHGGGAQAGQINTPNFGTALSAQSVVRLHVRASATLPAGYGQISALAGDQGGAGAWFWDASYSPVSARNSPVRARHSLVRVFHLSRSGDLTSWPLRGVPAVSAGFAVTRGGIAWLAAGSTLARLDTRTGQERTWALPPPRDNPAADANQPPGAAPGYQAQALAVSAAGLVAVADQNASSVQLLDPATGQVRQVLMPSADDVPQAVGFARDGTLGVGYQHVGSPHGSGVLLHRVAGPDLSRSVAESFGVTAYRTSSLIIGVSTPELVSATGRVRPLVLPVRQIDTTGGVLPPALLPGGRLATVVGAGIWSFPVGARSASQAFAGSVLFIPPVVRCGPSVLGGAPTVSATVAARPGQRPAGRCHLGIVLLATDARGDLWIVDGSGGRTVDWLGQG